MVENRETRQDVASSSPSMSDEWALLWHPWRRLKADGSVTIAC